jgi:hypothetical protein
MRRKLLIVVVLGAMLEIAWLYGGLELLRSRIGGGPVGRMMQQAKQVKTAIEKASEALKTLEQVTTAVLPPSPGDPSRNPFALPPGVRLLTEPSGTAGGEAGPSIEKELAKAAVPEPPARQLSGILVGPGDRVAIIDGTLVRAGDNLDGERVIDIQRDRVVLAQDGRERTLRLPPPFPESSPGTEQLQIRSPARGDQPKRPNGETKP